MLRLSVLFLLSFLFSNNSNAQRGQSIYAEILGAGVIYSLNYDTRFLEGEDKFGCRIGVSFVESGVVIPTQINYLLGKNKHKLEFGLGITSLLEFDSDKSIYIFGSGILMYRFQKPDGNFLFRVGLSPTFVPSEDDVLYGDIGKIFWFWPGISAGYKF